MPAQPKVKRHCFQLARLGRQCSRPDSHRCMAMPKGTRHDLDAQLAFPLQRQRFAADAAKPEMFHPPHRSTCHPLSYRIRHVEYENAPLVQVVERLAAARVRAMIHHKISPLPGSLFSSFSPAAESFSPCWIQNCVLFRPQNIDAPSQLRRCFCVSENSYPRRQKNFGDGKVFPCLKSTNADTR